MGAVIGDLLPLALGVAISPIPIIAVILMLLSRRAGGTSLGFAVGWVVGIVLAVVIFVAIGGAIGGSGSSSAAVGWIKIVLGIALLAVGAHQWRGRNDEKATPKWMSSIDDMRPTMAVAIGFALAAINPKNLIMCIGAGVTIGSAGLSVGGDIVAVVVFTVIAAATVLVPVIAYQAAAERLQQPLERLKEWLQANNATVMAVLILVIGVTLIGKGLGGV